MNEWILKSSLPESVKAKAKGPRRIVKLTRSLKSGQIRCHYEPCTALKPQKSLKPDNEDQTNDDEEQTDKEKKMKTSTEQTSD